MDARYDVFVSHTWAPADLAAVRPLVQALRDQGLEVFVDELEVGRFERITTTITGGLAASKVLLAFYSAAYPKSQACQWELTAAYLAAQQAGDPAERILVVNPEPGFDHLHPGELRDALAGRPPRPGDQEGLAELARAVAARARQVQGSLGAVVPTVSPRWLPTQGLGSTRFVDRLAEMWKLHSALHPETDRLTRVRTGPAAAYVHGLGGIGKSLLAEEYALRFGAAYPGGVFWLRAAGSYDETDLPPEELDARRHGGVLRIARLLGITTEGLSPDEVTGAVARAIQAAGQPCLWVVDDLPTGLNARQVGRWVSPNPLARTLFTTRSRNYGAVVTAVDLDELAHHDAYELLRIHRSPEGEDEEGAAHGIVESLGGHALALDVAGAALSTQQGSVSYGEFLRSLSEPDEDALELASELADALPTGHQASIARTLLRSIDQLGAEGQDFLRLAGSLASAPIPISFVSAVFQRADDLDDGQALRRAERAVAQASERSLARRVTAADDRTSNWLVHVLVVRAIRFRRSDQQRLAALRNAATAALTDSLQAMWDARAYAASQALVPHAREVVRHAATAPEAKLLGWVARYDQERGEFGVAAMGFGRQWDLFRRLLGEEQLDTLAATSDLAMSLRTLKKLTEAKELEEEVLASTRRMLGEDHPSTLTAKSNLAETLRMQGQLLSAKELQEQVLAGRRWMLGDEHEDTLLAMNALAMTLLTLGEPAVPHVGETFDMTIYGTRPDLPWAMEYLDQARELLPDLVTCTELTLGMDHPSTLIAKGNLAKLLTVMGALKAAMKLEAQVLAGLRRTLGEDHVSTLAAKGNLAETLGHLGKLEEARRLSEQVLAHTERVLGETHPLTRGAKEQLAAIQYAMKERRR